MGFEDKTWMPVSQDRFPDGTLHMTAPKDSLFKNSNVDIYWKYNNDAELFSLICLRKHYADCKNVTLYMPYCPHARMDRVKGTTDVFTLKSFADVINSLDFTKVVIYDAHSNVTPALIDRVENRPNTMFVERTLLDIGDDNLVMYYPDEGAMKRYSENCQRPYSFGMKRRNWETGKILGVDIINREIVKDKNILIVDDICSKGGTFYHSAQALKDAGAADIYLFITHCEDSIFKGSLLESGLIKHIYTTDSLGHDILFNKQITVYKLQEII
jgi:ribose-phosphate pyrophosphokinase